jgi:hypothetical protein
MLTNSQMVVVAHGETSVGIETPRRPPLPDDSVGAYAFHIYPFLSILFPLAFVFLTLAFLRFSSPT